MLHFLSYCPEYGVNLADQPSRYRGLCSLIVVRLRLPTSIQGLDALMNAIQKWDGGVVIISHDERFITTVANEVNILWYILFNELIVSAALGMWKSNCEQV